jgi:hypothetical protein
MRFVRCEACGAKALVAASQCPKCGHLLALRDDDGNEVPLARCRVCACYYPRSRGSCKWCVGAKPARSWTAMGAAAAGLTLVAGLSWGGWRFVGSRDAGGPSGVPAQAVITPAAVRTDSTFVMQAAGQVAATDEPSPSRRTRPAPAPARTTRANGAADADSTRTLAPRPASLQPAATTSSSLAPPSGSSSALAAGAPVTLVQPDSGLPAVILVGDKGIARTWVKLRAGTSRDAEVLGIIGPGTVVEFGESRRAWVRVSVDGRTGWAGRRLFSAAPR